MNNDMRTDHSKLKVTGAKELINIVRSK